MSYSGEQNQNNPGSGAVDSLTSQYAVLGAMARNGAYVIHQVEQTGLTNEHFDHAALSLLFRVICRVCQDTGARDGPVDKPLLRRTMAQEMRDLGMARPAHDDIIRVIYEKYSSPAAVVRHAEIVRDAAALRLTKTRLSALYGEADVFDGSVADFIAYAQQQVLGLTNPALEASQIVRVPELLPGFMESLHTEYNSPTGLLGISTGYTRLNLAIGGLQPGNLIIIAADTGHGKSALSLNIAANVARIGFSPCIFSYEMLQAELMRRLMFSEARIPRSRFAQKRMLAPDWQSLQMAQERVDQMRMRLYDDSSMTVAKIASMARYAKWCGECDLIIVDYTQLVTPDRSGGRSGDNREREVAQITEDLKRLAAQMKVCVIALSQLNDDGKMRESRAVKQHANIVLVLKCEDAKAGTDIDDADFLNYELIIEKNRDGKRTKIPMQFYPAYTRFDEEASFDHPDTDYSAHDTHHAYDHAAAASCASTSATAPASSQQSVAGTLGGQSGPDTAGSHAQPGFDDFDDTLGQPEPSGS